MTRTTSGSTRLNWDLIEEQRRIFQEAEEERRELEMEEAAFRSKAASSPAFRKVFGDWDPEAEANAEVGDQPRESEPIVQRALEGEKAALERLYSEYAEDMYRTMLGLTESPDVAEEVVQDVFLGLPEALRSYSGDVALEGWLENLAIRLAFRVRERRGGSKSADVLQYTAVNSDVLRALTPSPAALRALQKSLRRRLKKAGQRPPPKAWPLPRKVKAQTQYRRRGD